MHRAGRTRHAPTIALLSLQRHDPNRFDLVIADQTMPRMCGLVLARDLLSIRSTLPIILYTGYSDGLSELHHDALAESPWNARLPVQARSKSSTSASLPFSIVTWDISLTFSASPATSAWPLIVTVPRAMCT